MRDPRLDVLEQHVDDAVAAEADAPGLALLGGGVVGDDHRTAASAMRAAQHHVALETAAAHAPREPAIAGDQHARAGAPVRRALHAHDGGQQEGVELGGLADDALELVHGGQGAPAAAQVSHAVRNVE
jgi:hypothetical protein